jgi:hypothetical protein
VIVATDKAVWLSNLRTSLASMADGDYQRLAWFGQLPGVVSSPVETIEHVASDSGLDDFLLRGGFDLDENQRARGYHLLKLIDDFCENASELLYQPKVIDDPRWIEVRTAAGAFLESLQSLSLEQ